MTQATPELSLAVGRFVREAVHSIMAASNPSWARLAAVGTCPRV